MHTGQYGGLAGISVTLHFHCAEFESHLFNACVEFTCSSTSHLDFLHVPPTIQRHTDRLIGVSVVLIVYGHVCALW